MASGYSEKGCRGKQRFPRCSVISPPAPSGHWRRHHATESPGQHECGLCIPAPWSCFELLIAAGGKSGQMKEVNSSSLCYLFHKASAGNDIERSQEGCSRCKPLPSFSAPVSCLWVFTPAVMAALSPGWMHCLHHSIFSGCCRLLFPLCLFSLRRWTSWSHWNVPETSFLFHAMLSTVSGIQQVFKNTADLNFSLVLGI